MSEEVKPALLTKAEIDFLLGRLNPTPDFAKAMRYRIVKKLKTFISLELPLLKKAAETWPNLREALQPLVTPNSHPVTTYSHHQNTEPGMVVCKVAPGGGFEPPRPLRVTDLAGALKGFWDFLVIDQNLAKRTAKRYYSIVNRVLSQSGELTTDTLRSILKSVENPNTRANYVKAFRVFFKRYLGLNIADGFKIPQPTPKPIKVPPKEDLQAFFYALPSLQSKTAFLLWATTGRRRDEVLTLTLSDINIDERLIIRRVERGETKREWISVFNFETQEYLLRYLQTNPNPNRLFSYKHIRSAFKEAEEATGVKVTPQILREWFCNEMANLGVPDRYIDAFCGRTPKTILAKHYTEYTPQRLKKIYDQANLRVLT